MRTDYNKSVGRRLYEARKAKGYSRAKVGELVGLHETTVKRYEDGDIKSLDIERLKAFAEVLGTSATDLLGWISNSDDHAELMLHLSEENASGRTRAREDMFRLFGAEHATSELRLQGDKVALLYYKAMDRRTAPEMLGLVNEVEALNYQELENIRLLVQAYLRADAPIREIVDTALKPYRQEDILSEEIG